MTNLDKFLDDAQQRRGFRQSTRYTYRRDLNNIGIVDDSLTKEELESILLQMNNHSTRRSAINAIRVVLGIEFKMPKIFLESMAYRVRMPCASR